MRSIEVRGVGLAVDDRGSGPPLVWGHGLTSSMAAEDEMGLWSWDSLAGSARVVRYDARGHGASGSTPEPDDYRWEALAADQLALADALGIDRYVAGGASMGTATALHAAVRVPDRIAGLVLVIPPTAWETRAAQAELYEGGAAFAREHGPAALAEVTAEQPPPPVLADEPELADVSRRRLAAYDPDVLPVVLAGAARSQLPDRDAIASLTVPAVILAWEGDPGHPVSTAEELARLLPQARLEVAGSVAAMAGWPALVGEVVARAEC